MDQESTIDFKALRAKFQDEDLPLKQPRFKPALPDKPKVVPPPQSPTHYVPVGARPSLLTSINQSLEGKTVNAPRVVFKDDKKDMKKPLIQTLSTGKDKSEGKLKGAKDKTKEGKGKLDENLGDQKQKKENGKDKRFSLGFPSLQKENTAELVPATAPPKSAAIKKKGLLSLIKSKRDSVEVTADPILDTPSLDVPGPAPLIPVPSDFGNPEPELSVPEALLLNSRTLSDSSAAETTPSFAVPESPAFIPPPVFTPDIPAPEIPPAEVDLSPEVEDPAVPVLRPNSQIEIIPSSSGFPLSTPPPPVASTPSPTPPEPALPAAPDIEAMISAALEKPPVPAVDPPPRQPSPKVEHPISALSALERAEDMAPEKKRVSVDQRIFSALEKARRKTTSSLLNPTLPHPVTPPPEEFPASSLLDLPPIDYEGAARGPQVPKVEQVNGIDPGQASPVLGGAGEEGPEPLPELLVVPSPPSQNSALAIDSPGLPPEKPTRPSSTNLGDLIPPPFLGDNGLPEFSGTDTTDVPEFDDVTSGVPSPEVSLTEWGGEALTGLDLAEGDNVPQVQGNGIVLPGTEVSAEPLDGEEYQNNLLPNAPLTVPDGAPPAVGPLVVNGSSPYESAENAYEDVSISATKKKGKQDKKRKGPPKNPYAESAQEPNQEKTKTSRFGKTDKKATTEGPDEKELKKREKQRLEKEKKELKEKQEREKKEQKERERKESELKKKFNITGQEDAIYQANVTVTTKGRKNDLPLRNGDVISIIRTTNCPKGKWLARDNSNNYGYVAVDHVELDIKEMLELGKKARKTSSNVTEPDAAGAGNRLSNHFPLAGESFEDDSEEWNDDDEPVSPSTEAADPLASVSHTRALSMPDMPDSANNDLSINHQHSHSDIQAEGSHTQAKHEALQKLATFFHTPKAVESTVSNSEPDTSPVQVTEGAVQASDEGPPQDTDEYPDTFILPPPDLYADLTVE